MRPVYTLLIRMYGAMLWLASRFNAKAGFWIDGRRGWAGRLQEELNRLPATGERAWFHASSLGEFEQGRPIIEAYRQQFPARQIILTFFSPSGYNVRKDYSGADLVCYLPLDTPANAKRFVGMVNPQIAIFIKYDFWYNFLQALSHRHVPVCFVSVRFRPGQPYFRWYGAWFRGQLRGVTRFFVQNDSSAHLLRSIGIDRATLAGDTRFDRVWAIAQQPEEFPLISAFAGTDPILIGGSTWREDENLLLPLIERRPNRLRFILAPHDTSPGRIREITTRLTRPWACYSTLTEAECRSAEVLIIDSVGILSRLYRYATLAFIGGGFGSGLHNIQEPITFGVPVCFGPRYHKFSEAVDLVEQGGAFCVEEAKQLATIVDELLEDEARYRKVSDLCRRYVEEHRGATATVMGFLSGI